MSLLSTHKSSDSGLLISLHPLVLLTISDYITRHVLRGKETPMVGALLGQQIGRSVTLEQAFECQLLQEDNGKTSLHDVWFKDRLQQYKDVHKSPALELVGWFTTAPSTGPEAIHLPIHKQISDNYNETAVLLTLHPGLILSGQQSAGGKLPLTIYESLYESGADDGEDINMGEAEKPLELRFRELPYSIETGEAEMIGVDFVARGGGNATAVKGTVEIEKESQTSQIPVGQVDMQGNRTMDGEAAAEDSQLLSPEDDELIASLTARANAVKMLHTRIKLLRSYLSALPPSYLTAAISDSTSANTTSSVETSATPDHTLLRSIQSLLSRLPLILPSTVEADYNAESLAEKSDVELAGLLATLGQSVKHAKELGRKSAIIESSKSSARKMNVDFASKPMDFGGYDDLDGGSGLLQNHY